MTFRGTFDLTLDAKNRLTVTTRYRAAFAEGVGVELFGLYWDTSLQQHVPGEVLSRVSSYDALGSWVLVPIGFILPHN